MTDGALAAGTLVAGRYRIDAVLGVGGMALVYRATDVRLRRELALKVLRGASDAGVGRLQREARVAALASGPGVLRVLDVGVDGELAYLAMELLAGETLYARTCREPATLPRALAWVGRAAETMARVHARGVVHRDLKPENLFLDRGRGEREPVGEVLVVVDFGLAFAAAASDPDLGRMTSPDETAGTPTYIAPEQILDCEVGPPADVYALGGVLFELLAGAPMFSGDRAALVARHLYAPAPAVRDRAPWVPAEVGALVARMVAKSPLQRPAMGEVADLCRALAEAHAARTERGPARAPALPCPSTRASRALTARTRRAEPAAVPIGGRVLVLGPDTDELCVALAASALAPTSDPGAAHDVVLALGPADDAELARWIARGAPVVVATAAGDLEGVTRLVRRGAADVVTVPVRGDEVARKLHRILRDRARRAS